MVCVYVLKLKNHTFEAFRTWKKMVEYQKESYIKTIRINDGLQLCNKEFTQMCNKNGIIRRLIASGNLKQNGVAERMNITLLEKVSCMLFHAKLPKSF